MKINPTTSTPHQRLLAVMLGVVLLLEASFWFFGVVSRPTTVFDLQALSVIAILVCAQPKYFQTTFWLAPKRLSIISQLCLFGIIYLVILKSAYFMGYFAGLIFKAK